MIIIIIVVFIFWKALHYTHVEGSSLHIEGSLLHMARSLLNIEGSLLHEQLDAQDAERRGWHAHLLVWGLERERVKERERGRERRRERERRE